MTEQTFGMRPELIIDCPHEKCGQPVFEVQLGPGLTRTMLDAGPITWADGGRIRVLSAVPVKEGEAPFARRVAHAGMAFGVRHLYRPHAETCRIDQRRTRTKATSS